MPRMTAAEAAVHILEKEGISQAFGVPGAAINPFYAALRRRASIAHVLARHVEAAAHMADGYSRAAPGHIGLCIGTSGPAGTDMITGLYAAQADSIPILCITGQAPRARLYKEDFQAVDIESIARPVTKLAVTVREPGQLPGVLQQAFALMRSARPGPVLIDLPIDVQLAEIEFDPELYQPLEVARPRPSQAQVERVLEMLQAAERPLIVAGGGVLLADASEQLRAFAELTGVPVVPTLMGWGVVPDDHPLMAGMVGLQTAHRSGNASLLEADFVLGIGNRWANRHTGSIDVYTRGRRFVHIDIEPTQIGRVFTPDLGITADAGAALDMLLAAARGRELRDRGAWAQACASRRRTMLRRDDFAEVPVKPQRVYRELVAAFGSNARYVTTIGLSQIAAAQFLKVSKPRHWINAGQAGPLGWTMPAALGLRAADPNSEIVALSGDYDFQFLIEELAVGAQFKLPYIHIVLNNAYLGLIRQSQRAFSMDYCVQLSFDNINAPDLDGYGVDHVAVAQGLGCKAIRVRDPDQIQAAIAQAREWIAEYSVPVVVEIIVERVTNIAMGSEIDNVTEFEPVIDLIEA
ncbi:glyoxylate carboligase [mine drainage metagenome]|uniref:Glyoxylate carboligase n=1 Tax=mine drainage metagenome TaxID=410659 RepID=A0A1J5QRV9_9ZZZZ